MDHSFSLSSSSFSIPFNFDQVRPIQNTFVKKMINKLNDGDFAKFYGFSIRHRNDPFLFMQQIRRKGWDQKDDNETLECYRQLLKHAEWILFELIYKINQLRLIITPLNMDLIDHRMKLLYLEFLLTILLTIMLKMRALSMHKIQLLLETKQIYSDLLKTMKLPERDFLLQLDKCWLEDYMAKYDKYFDSRLVIQGYYSKPEELKFLSEESNALMFNFRLHILQSMNTELHHFFNKTKIKPKPIKESNVKQHEAPRLQFIDSVCSTPIFYSNDDDIHFQDEDGLALKKSELFDNDIQQITLTTSPFSKSIHNLFINNKSFCDCGRHDCNGCYPTCLTCGEKKCFAICRSNVSFNYYDVFYQAQTIDKFDPLYLSNDSDNNDNGNQQQQQECTTDDDNSAETPLEQLSRSNSIDDELTILSPVPYGPQNIDNSPSEFFSQTSINILSGDEVESFFSLPPSLDHNFREKNDGGKKYNSN